MKAHDDRRDVAPAEPFIVGANMPWGEWCGHDFGLQPWGWGEQRQDWGKIERELQGLRALGVSVVRWFVLASGVNYPCRSAGPNIGAKRGERLAQAIDLHARRVRAARGFEWQWIQAPPPLSREFLDDFIALCRACQNAGLRLIPSLVSFEWFQPPRHQGRGVYGGGRRQLIFGSPGHDVRAGVRAFLGATLRPLLERTTATFGPPRAHAHPIFAWESINEPDWVTQGGPWLVSAPFHDVSAYQMNIFLAEHRKLVLTAGYDHSIGFKHFSPSWLEPALREALIADGERYWHQGHHFPTAGFAGLLEGRLATNRTLPARPAEFARCLVGEFPTGQGRRRVPSNWRWGDPELAASEGDSRDYLRARLQLAVERGYDGALFWSAKAGGHDPRNDWSLNVQRQVSRFTAAAPRRRR
jgi:hypothetical protein